MNTILKNDEIQSLLYPYLDSGMNQETFKIDELSFSSELAIAKCTVRNMFFYQDEGRAHLSGPMALSIVAQSAIVFLKKLFSCSSQTSPVWMKEFEISCHQKIDIQENLQVDLRIRSAKKTLKSHEVMLDFRIDHGKFLGKISLVLVRV